MAIPAWAPLDSPCESSPSGLGPPEGLAVGSVGPCPVVIEPIEAGVEEGGGAPFGVPGDAEGPDEPDPPDGEGGEGDAGE